MSVRQFALAYVFAGLGLTLIYLGITGRLHWLFVLAGGLMPFFATALRGGMRILQTVALFKKASSLFNRPAAGGSGQSGSSNQISRIKTRYLDMTLDHDSGDLDGDVLTGQFAGRSLSQLDLRQTVVLLEECQSDNDSVNLLQAYLAASTWKN